MHYDNTCYLLIKPIIFLLLFLLPGWAVKANTPTVVGSRLHYGFILPHSQSIEELADAHPYGITLDGSKLFTGKEAWNYCFCYPRIGASLSYFNFNHRSIIGEGLVSSLYVEPFLTYRKQLNISYRFGLGPVYLSQPYDAENNPQNLFYSTHISFIVYLKLSLHYRFNKRYTLRLSGNYNHISNGGIQLPNKGINYPTFSMGVDYHFRKPKLKEHRKTDKALYKDKWWSDLVFFFTGKNKVRRERKLYPVFGGAFHVNYLIGRLNALSCGVEFEANRALRAKLDQKNIATSHRKGGFLLGHHLLIGRFSFNQYIGVYFYAPRKPMDQLYQRYELTYRITDTFFTGINLKAHRHVADFMDLRLGIRM